MPRKPALTRKQFRAWGSLGGQARKAKLTSAQLRAQAEHARLHRTDIGHAAKTGTHD